MTQEDLKDLGRIMTPLEAWERLTSYEEKIRLQELNEIRDKFAMSLNHIPDIDSFSDTKEICSILGIEPNYTNVESRLDFDFKYEAYVRYKYADAMIEERNKNNNL